VTESLHRKESHAYEISRINSRTKRSNGWGCAKKSKSTRVNRVEIAKTACDSKRSNHQTKVDAASVNPAENTLKSSTTRAVCFFPKNGDLSRRFHTRQGQLRYQHLRTRWYTDTLYPGAKITKSMRGHTCTQIYCNTRGGPKSTQCNQRGTAAAL
jgi:hypothetical protein